MIDQIIGAVQKKTPSNVLIESPMGIVFSVFVTPRTVEELPEVGEKARLFIHTQVITMKAEVRLCGFLNESERAFFHQLIKVKGIGASSALRIMSCASIKDMQEQISNQNVSFFTKMKGVGKKTAQTIISELSGNLVFLEDEGEENSQLIEEAKLALLSLGYIEKDFEKYLEKFKDEDFKDASDFVKKVLKG